MKTLLFAFLAAVMTAQAADIQVKRYTTSEQDWGTNAYWLVGDKGIVVIDSLLRESDAQNFAALLKAQQRPVLGMILTHPHSDHYSGIPQLKRVLGDFPVYATAATADALAADFAKFKQNSAEQFAGDIYLGGPPKVDKLIDTTAPLQLGDLAFEVQDLGEGEAANMTVIYQPQSRSLFVGDILMAHHHYYVGQGNLDNILRQFATLQADYQGRQVTLYGGHGDPGALNLLQMQADYVYHTRQTFQTMMTEPANLQQGKPSRDAILEAARTIVNAYPYLNNYGYAEGTIVQMNLINLFRRQQSAQVKATGS
ncbi:MBL fold metallo-hydrolase [Bowmanella dokdonensis]|uniref:MBL fold metallo-hydrolase n=1 Tax=Bowmanella dokdonensis TaxID=751969 RepID=A0A939DMJ6_9ALTE|nr:MBL fold metallo-hydrolase [Bowmanella dokdonensis]MBN7825339.1 MBL fold metallo-hydrolase [Bowmanella dokdonensis]